MGGLKNDVVIVSRTDALLQNRHLALQLYASSEGICIYLVTGARSLVLFGT